MKKTIFLCILIILATRLHAQNQYFRLAEPNETKVYSIEVIPQIPVTSLLPLTGAPVGAAIQTVTYYDEMGRTEQIHAVGSGGSGENIVKFFEYADYSRIEKEYLPFAVNNNGAYVTNPAGVQSQFYKLQGSDIPVDSVPYSKLEYDNSPLRRVISVVGPGETWQQSGIHQIENSFLYNQSGEVLKWIYDPSIGSFRSDTTYDVGTLIAGKKTDENGRISITYTDQQGLVVMSKSEELKTYYIYDNFNRLVYVIQPEGLKVLINQHPDSHIILDWDNQGIRNYCFKYSYDEYGRQVEKWIPGTTDCIYIVYDRLGRVTMIQNPKMRSSNQWYFEKRDALGRTILSGIYSSNLSRQEIQSQFDNPSTIVYETKISSGIMGYTNNSLPSITAENVYKVNYYDSYTACPGLSPAFIRPSSGFSTLSPTSNVKGMLTISRRRVLNSSAFLTTAMFYDLKGRLVQTQAGNIKGNTDIVTYLLDFSGKVIYSLTQHKVTINGSSTGRDIKGYISYDAANRVKKLEYEISGDPTGKVIATEINYNELGQIKEKNLHKKSDGSFLQSIDFSYNIRGWLTAINSPETSGPDNDLFGMSLTYDESVGNGQALYNGLISGMKWQVFQGQHTGIRGYSFEYDNNYRLINAFYGEGPSLSNNVGRYSVLNITYDDNGNILTLNRNGRQSQVNEPEQYGPIDQLQYNYSGNQLVSVSDGVSGITNQDNFIDRVNLPQEYSYDSMGNMITDYNKQISSVTYNFLNLPEVVTFQNNSRIEYTYDASGLKLRKKVFNSSGTLICNEEYIGGIIYQNNVLASMAISDGRVVFTSGGNATYQYFIKDQAGSIRVVFEKGANGLASLVEENHYYPFGMNMSGLSTGDSRFRFGGKEYQEDLGLLWYDFSARNYDAQLGRWFNIDPMAEKYGSYSPYVYCLNNPQNFIDPDGMISYTYYGEEAQAFFLHLQLLEMNGNVMDIFKRNYLANSSDLGGSGDKSSTRTFNPSGPKGADGPEEEFRPDSDGYLTFLEAKYWYQFGHGEPLYLDLSKIDFSKVHLSDFKNGRATIYLLSNHRVNYIDGLVHGRVELELLSDTKYAVAAFNDEVNGRGELYNFNLVSGAGLKRNTGTVLGGIVSGFTFFPLFPMPVFIGTPYPIYFYGSVKIQP